MKKLIFSKFLIDSFQFFLMISITATLIVWIIQAVNYLDFVTEDGHNFKVYILYAILNFPKIFSRLLPFIFFISLFYTLIKYENKNELIIYWINGIKKISFINNIVYFSFIYLIFQILLTSYFVPKFQDQARSYIRNSNVDFFPSLIKEKKFIDTVSDLTIFIGKKKKNYLENIYLKDSTKLDQIQIIIAKNGLIKKKKNINFLILYDGKILNSKTEEGISKGKTTSFSFKKTEFNLSNYATKSTTYPKVGELNTNILIKCLQKLLLKKDNFTEKNITCNNDALADIKQEILKRIYLPLYIPIISLITSFLVLKSRDDFNYTSFKFKIFLYVLSILIISEISLKYSALGGMFDYIFLLIPLILFFINYVYLLNKLKFLK